MLKNKGKIFPFLVFALFLFVVGCGREEFGTCHMRDDRFACEGKLNAAGEAEINFTKAGKKNFTVTDFQLDKVDENGDANYFTDCHLKLNSNTSVADGKTVFAVCPKLEPGIYYFKFSLNHSEPEKYQPKKSETCTLKRGRQTKWYCRTGGEFKYRIE